MLTSTKAYYKDKEYNRIRITAVDVAVAVAVAWYPYLENAR